MAVRFLELYEETREAYQLKIIAGGKGMDCVISWVHLLEDESVVSRFRGNELAVTTAMRAAVPGWLMHLVKALHSADCAGLIVNTGMYLSRLPEELVAWCDAHDFPLLEAPWSVYISELTQDYCMRIMRQAQKEKEDGSMFARLLRGQEVPQEFLEDIGSRCNIHGSFRIFCLYPKYSPEDKLLFRQALLRLENVFGLWQRGHKVRFPYFLVNLHEFYVLAVNDLPEDAVAALTEQIHSLFAPFFERHQLALGVGPSCPDIYALKSALRRARIAMKMARDMQRDIVYYEEMGFFGILFSTEDTDILKEYAERLLSPLDAYDARHGNTEEDGYLATLRSYIQHDRSLLAVAQATYTHRNTVNYRIQNIKKLLNSELKTMEELFPYQIAFYIRDMGL